MNSTRIFLGASVIMLCVASTGVEARMVTYEINGKQYSYSTNNRAQTALAKKRIAAAKKAAAAKAKADQEKAKHPLVAIVGSATQQEAKEAQEALNALLGEKAEVAAAEVETSPAAERRVDRREKRRDDRKNDIKREVATASAPQRRTEKAAAPTPPAPAPAPTHVAAASTPPALPAQASPPHPSKVRSISFDVETGIKTTIMVDGAIEEEPFDSSVLPHLAAEQGRASSLMAFVKQLRKAAPEETTGSITATAFPPPQSLRLPR